MATIKLQPSGAVVIKEGKVACSCCEVCCPYPAQLLVIQSYSSSDLPDAVTVDGVSYARNGTSYGDTTNGVLLEGNVWVKYKNGVRSPRPCLIQGGVEDQFADTYTVSGEPLGSVTLTRVSLCLWTGLDSCGNTVFLELFADLDDGRIWYLEFPSYISPCVLEEWSPIRAVENIGYGNTPVGSYGSEPYDEVVLSVS